MSDRPPARIGLLRIVCLGLSQLIGWGATHYLIATFGRPIASELGLPSAGVQAGFALGLITMGLVSPAAGRWIDRHGGRPVLIAGCLLGAAGIGVLATAGHLAPFLAAWVMIGLAMRLCLYDAAFAALARIGGPDTRRAMAIITLFGGLASTVFWPLAAWLNSELGWRNALWVHALLLAATALLHLALPDHAPASQRKGGGQSEPPASGPPTVPEVAAGGDGWLQAGIRAPDIAAFAVVAVAVLYLQTALAAHLLAVLDGLGASPAQVVAWASLMGLGQVAGRLAALGLADRIHPLRLNLLPGLLLTASFGLALLASHGSIALPGFVLLYGAGNGIATITRGTVPLVLFAHDRYGEAVGRILRPAFLLSATAPVSFALLLESGGARGLATAALGIAALVLLASTRLLHAARR